MTTQVSFGSTYRIPLHGQGINKGNAERFKNWLTTTNYKNVLYPNKNNGGAMRVSIKADEDNIFEKAIKDHGYKVFQKFDRHEVPVEEMDAYIKEQLDNRNYEPFGEQMRPIRKKRR